MDSSYIESDCEKKLTQVLGCLRTVHVIRKIGRSGTKDRSESMCMCITVLSL